MYIPTGMKSELVRFGLNFDQKRQVIDICEGSVTIPSSGQTISGFVQIEGMQVTSSD
jgi:hypothetical protein